MRDDNAGLAQTLARLYIVYLVDWIPDQIEEASRIVPSFAPERFLRPREFKLVLIGSSLLQLDQNSRRSIRRHSHETCRLPRPMSLVGSRKLRQEPNR